VHKKVHKWEIRAQKGAWYVHKCWLCHNLQHLCTFLCTSGSSNS